MSGNGWRRIGLGLTLIALITLAGCGVKGDPVAPAPTADEQAD